MLIQIKDVMIIPQTNIYKKQSLDHAVRQMKEQRTFAVIVYDYNEQQVGVLSLVDALAGIYEGKTIVDQAFRCDAESLNESEPLIHTRELNDGEILLVRNNKGFVTGFVNNEILLRIKYMVANEKLMEMDATFNSAHNGILAIDKNGIITSMNPAAEQMARKSREESIGSFLNDVVNPDGLLEVIRTGLPQYGKRYQVGSRKYITNRSPIVREGDIVGAVGVFQDISEIESISEELSIVKGMMRELDTMLDASGDPMLITDMSGKVLRTNQLFRQIVMDLGQGVSYYDDLIPDIFDESMIPMILANGSSITTLVYHKRNGRYYLASGTPVKNDQGEMIRVVLNFRDVSEIDHMRRELEKTKDLSNQYLLELKRLKSMPRDDGFIATSPRMKQVLDLVERVTLVDSTVLILGESGVGKEETVNLIHRNGLRSHKPMVKINCGAIPEQLLESDLFGYEGDAFTGAKKTGKPGMFEQADEGTLFLNEIAEISPTLQVKLLRVLQEREVMRIGGVKPRRVNIRIIAATNRDLEEEVKAGRFREDLFFQLHVVPIHVPPLRQRREDIPLFINYFLSLFQEKYGIYKNISPDVVETLVQYDWPGNVRELSNLIERLLVTTSGSEISFEDLLAIKPNGTVKSMIYVSGILPLKEAVQDVEKQLINKAILAYKNTRKAARVLHVDQSTVVRKMQKYGVQLKEEAEE